MDTITHALVPVITASYCRGDGKWLRRFGLVGIGVAGALPDLLSPHLTLEARMASWSHGLPFWALFSLVALLVAFISKGRVSWQLSTALSAAYLLHLCCDAISGGINWLYPVRDLVWGRFWVDALWWIPLDVFFVLWAYYLFRLKPLWLRRKQAGRSGGGDPPATAA